MADGVNKLFQFFVNTTFLKKTYLASGRRWHFCSGRPQLSCGFYLLTSPLHSSVVKFTGWLNTAIGPSEDYRGLVWSVQQGPLGLGASFT